MTQENTAPHPRYLAQSECTAVANCQFAAFARYEARYRGGDETRAQRIGSIGHAFLAERVRARVAGREPDYHGAIEAERDKRGWPQLLIDELEIAEGAAGLIADELRLDTLRPVPDFWGADGKSGPLADVSVRVPWKRVLELYRAEGLGGAADDIARCLAVRGRYAGIEGHPDLVVYTGEVVTIIDYKLRTRLDMREEPEVSQVPDRQFAFYAVLLRAAGLDAPHGFELMQVNAFAGRWATVDDFVRVASGGARSSEELEMVLHTGLPTRDMARLGRAGYAVTAEVWGEAVKVLAARRGKGLTPAEMTGAHEFVRALSTQRPVIVRRMRAEMSVSLEVVRDMIVGVDGWAGLIERGLVPPRNLQSWQLSPCMRAGGCAVRGLCLSTLGTLRGGAQAFDEAALATELAAGGGA